MVSVRTWCVKTYREGRIGINLILGGDAKAGVAVSSGPRQVDRCLQLVVNLLVDGAAELGTVVSERTHNIYFCCDSKPVAELGSPREYPA